MAAKTQGNSVWFFAHQYFLHSFDGERLKINAVGHVFVCLHGGNVWVNEHCFDAFCLKRLYGLRARIVKLASLTYPQAARTKHNDFFYTLHSMAPNFLNKS